MFLYDKLDGAREYGGLKSLPEFLAANLNPSFELRAYQRRAFENFITHFESANCPRPTQVLFHMATGSGKTLIMAGLILYLYERGYRNFLFFVNLSNIVEKTRENFLNAASAKYLFADEIILDGKRIRVNAVENFQDADADAINICFSTTQGLHITMNFVKEGGMSVEDFDERKTVLISDEAHHLNVDTKKFSAAEEDNRRSWEATVKKIFHRNAGNVLLEFTATCDLNNKKIRAEYKDKIIFNYALLDFYRDGYSKDIITIRSELTLWERVLQALILSQYRLKVFADNRLNVKPVILFKAAKIQDSKDFMKNFIAGVKNLTGENLRGLSKKIQNKIVRRAFEYFERQGITFENLAAELRDDFSEEHCISVNDDSDANNKQILLNSLEEVSNPYRAIFEVKKLDEGWDVLNLFDIVRLYETRQSGKKISPVTISEAQLIGRGARYFPFKLNDAPKFQRKFDSDVTCDLRACETLYYHCQNDHRYVDELHRALHEIGLDIKKIVKREYRLKENFKRDELYQSGVIFLNGREEVGCKDIREFIGKEVYSFQAAEKSGTDKIMTASVETVDEKIELHTTRKTLGDIAKKNYAVVNKALARHPIYNFDSLKKYFPALKSTRQFVTEYLSGVRIDIKSRELEPSISTLYEAVCHVVEKISKIISESETTYRGTEKFFARSINEIFKDKTVNYSEVHAGGFGVSQNDSSVEGELKIDLSAEDWFAYNDNCGTVEEKAFVAYFKDRVEELKKFYDKIYLVRNERAFGIFSFEDGVRFEPDFVLFLQRKNGSEQFQIFIEPKGEHLSAKDAWKEKFLIRLKEKAMPVKIFADDTDYKIWGLKFFNRDDLSEFDSEFRALTELD